MVLQPVIFPQFLTYVWLFSMSHILVYDPYLLWFHQIYFEKILSTSSIYEYLSTTHKIIHELYSWLAESEPMHFLYFSHYSDFLFYEVLYIKFKALKINQIMPNILSYKLWE